MMAILVFHGFNIGKVIIFHSFLLPPSPSKVSHLPPRKNNVQTFPLLASRLISNSLIVYRFVDSEPQLDKSNEFNNQGMKGQVKRAFNSYFLCYKKTSKNSRPLHPPIQVYSRCLSSLFQYQRFLMLPPSEHLNTQVRINKRVNSVYHPSPTRFTSRIHPLIFLYTPQGFKSLKIIS